MQCKQYITRHVPSVLYDVILYHHQRRISDSFHWEKWIPEINIIAKSPQESELNLQRNLQPKIPNILPNRKRNISGRPQSKAVKILCLQPLDEYTGQRNKSHDKNLISIRKFSFLCFYPLSPLFDSTNMKQITDIKYCIYSSIERVLGSVFPCRESQCKQVIFF